MPNYFVLLIFHKKLTMMKRTTNALQKKIYLCKLNQVFNL